MCRRRDEGGNIINDPRIGKRVQLHPATDTWMRGDRYGVIVSVSRKARSFLDPRDRATAIPFA